MKSALERAALKVSRLIHLMQYNMLMIPLLIKLNISVTAPNIKQFNL